MPALGQKLSPEVRAKISAAATGRKHTPETRAKIRAGNLGKTISPETRAKISVASTGRKLTPEHCANISTGKKGAFGSPEERFMRRVRKTRGCWLWEGFIRFDGYGMFDSKQAHRFSYELFVGPIKPGNHIHHICHTRLCMKPAHLEQVNGRDHKDIHSRPDGWERYLYKKALR